MTFVVPFDGSTLAEAALVRADEYADALDQDVLAIVVIPESRRYAVRKGWIEHGEEFTPRQIAGDLHRRVTDIAPETSFETRRVEGDAPEGAIANAIRKRAREVSASVVFIGSDNAGRILVSLSSVGGSVASDVTYDIHIVRKKRPPRIERLGERSEFYFGE